jgi:hypothetical protein
MNVKHTVNSPGYQPRISQGCYETQRYFKDLFLISDCDSEEGRCPSDEPP